MDSMNSNSDIDDDSETDYNEIMPRGMSNEEIEEFIFKHGGKHMNKEFAGVYSANTVPSSAEILQSLRTVNHNLAFLIANTDPSEEPGTHWWTIINIVPANAIYFFDSFGILGWKRFILQDDIKLLSNVLTSEETEIINNIEFETLKFNIDVYSDLEDDSLNELSPAAAGFLEFLLAFAKYNKIKHFIKINVVKDSLQDLNTSYCGAFCLYLLYNLFNPEDSSSIIDDSFVTADTLNQLISELFHNETKTTLNSKIMKKFIKEYNIKGSFD